MTELLPCPFCGGDADPKGWMSTEEDGSTRIGPACDKCGGSAGSVDAWNTRIGTNEKFTKEKEANLANFRFGQEQFERAEIVEAELASAKIGLQRIVNIGLEPRPDHSDGLKIGQMIEAAQSALSKSTSSRSP